MAWAQEALLSSTVDPFISWFSGVGIIINFILWQNLQAYMRVFGLSFEGGQLFNELVQM